MRLFLSVNLLPEIKKKIITIRNRVKEITSHINNLYIKWEKDENLHITIFFIGEVSEFKLKEIIVSLESIKLDVKEGIIKGKNINAFPDFSYPRVIFVDLIDENNWLKILHTNICNKLEQLGFLPDKKFHNHITLGRVKRQIKFPPEIDFKNINCDFEFKANSFSLMQSTLTPAGSIYKEIKKFSF